jgi:ATP-dependent RNA helicase RhlE
MISGDWIIIKRMTMSALTPALGFNDTGLTPEVLAALTKNGITVPTPIQAKAIPVGLTGQDIIGIAQTGTGKTFAFGLPIIEHLRKNDGKAVILVPTRELALQVEESLRAVTRNLPQPIRTVCLIGGMPIYRQIQILRNHPRLIVATPGRLQDHLNQRTVTLADANIVVLDEADRMLDMGFAPQIKQILNAVPDKRQMMLFSATMAPEIAQLAAAYLENPERIEVQKAGSNNEQIAQELCYVSNDKKHDLLHTVLNAHSGSVLVFSRTKHGAKKLTFKLQQTGHTAAEIHSNRSLGQRRQALDGFKSGRYRVLVATDVASRGIDVPDVALVVNFDLPDASEDYIHRIGRTGRAGKTGKAISFATPDQRRDVAGIERLMNKKMALSEHSVIAVPDRVQNQPMGGGGSNRRFRGSSQGSRRPNSTGNGGFGAPRRSDSGGYGSQRRSGGGRSTTSSRPQRMVSDRVPKFGGF